jgi:hypothetical protein
MGLFTPLISFGAKQQLVLICGERWRELRNHRVFDRSPSIDFRLDPGILENLIRLQFQVLLLSNKLAQPLHLLEELLLPRACKQKKEA